MTEVRALASIAVLAGVLFPGVAIAYRIGTDDAMAWAALGGVLLIVLVVALTGLFLALQRWAVFRADTEAILSQRARTNATIDATARTAGGGPSPAMPWLIMPGDASGRQLGAPDAAGYDPLDLADVGSYAGGVTAGR